MQTTTTLKQDCTHAHHNHFDDPIYLWLHRYLIGDPSEPTVKRWMENFVLPHVHIWLFDVGIYVHTSNSCKALSGERRCVREGRGYGRNNILPDDYFSRCTIGHNMKHCPNHSLIEALIQFLEEWKCITFSVGSSGSAFSEN